MKFALLAEITNNYSDWKAWLAPCLADQPDMDSLALAPGVRFQSIDANFPML